MNYPSFTPASRPVSAAPALKEERFPLTSAVNYKEMTSWLTPDQKTFLEKHRFVLLPTAQVSSVKNGYTYWDEMLVKLAEIGGSQHPEERLPENAMLVTPDPFLRAMHKYVSERLKEVETEVLAPALQRYLAAMYDNTLRLKAQASPQSLPDWERLQAKMLVPLLLAENCRVPELGSAYASNAEAQAAADAVDTIASALALLDGYRSGLSRDAAAGVEAELRLIYAATQTGRMETDYTRYAPRGHYERSAVTRSYFRAMIHLSHGWNLKDDDGVRDALNFALAMSLPVSPEFAAAVKKTSAASPDPLENWRTIMSISALYAGYPDEAAYPEWADYVRKRLPDHALTADSSSDPAIITALNGGLDNLKARSPFFSTLWTPEQTAMLRVFPQRFTAAWLVADSLTAKDGIPELPSTFSGLWMPMVFGSEYAASLLPEQTRRLASRIATATSDIGPAEGEVHGPQDVADVWAKTLRDKADTLKTQLAAVPEESWFSSIGAAWLYLLRTQTATYGAGYPLYMQDPAFAAKQLQTYMGSYTELKHDMLLYEKPNYAEGGEGVEGDIPPVPKGFVEPNLPFWNELLRITRMLQAIEGAQREDMQDDQERSYSGLKGFAWRINLCIALAEKELRNEPITDEEYEDLRTGMNLDFMAEPFGGELYSDEDQYLSGLIVDVQTDVASQLVVYEATAKPMYMMAMVGNENSPRLVLGVVYNHYEFTAPTGPRFTDKQWKARVYHGPAPEADAGQVMTRRGWSAPGHSNPTGLPEKNFWYAPLTGQGEPK